MNSCDEMKQLMSLYIDGELNQALHTKFEKHIKACEACRSQLDEIKQVVEICRSFNEVELPPNFRSDLHNKLIKASQNGPARNISIFMPVKYIKLFSSIAAVLVLVFVLRWFFNNSYLLPSGEMSTRSLKDATFESQVPADDVLIKGEAKEKQENAGFSISANQTKTFSAEEDSWTKDVNGRSTTEYTRSMAKQAQGIGNPIVRRNVDVTMSIDSDNTLSQQVEKIEEFSLANGAMLADQDEELESITMEPLDSREDEAVIEIKVPNVDYDKFIKQLAEEFGAENVHVGELTTVDLTHRFEELNIELENIYERLGDAEENGDTSSGQETLDELKNKKDEIMADVDRIMLDSDLIYITIILKEKE